MAETHPPSQSITDTPRTSPAPQRKDRRWLTVSVLLVAVALVTVLRLGILSSLSGGIKGVTTFDNLSREHTDGSVPYAQTPPVGGPHNQVWQNCGVYDQPILNEHAVQTLERGAIWITYRPELSADDIERLRTFARNQSYVLLSPYPGLPAPVILSAWGIQVRVDEVTDPRIERFITRYVQGPQTPELSTVCSGGVGMPIGTP